MGAPLQLPGCPPACLSDQQPRTIIPSTVRTYAEVLASPPPFSTGDLVYIRQGGQPSPLQAAYTGPFEVLRVHGKAVQVKLGDREDWISADRLKRHTVPPQWFPL